MNRAPHTQTVPYSSATKQEARSAKQTSVADHSPQNELAAWLDKQDLLQLMHISTRTLQRWRSKKLLPFTRIGGKIYYRKVDVMSLLFKNMRTV